MFLIFRNRSFCVAFLGAVFWPLAAVAVLLSGNSEHKKGGPAVLTPDGTSVTSVYTGLNVSAYYLAHRNDLMRFQGNCCGSEQ